MIEFREAIIEIVSSILYLSEQGSSNKEFEGLKGSWFTFRESYGTVSLENLLPTARDRLLHMNLEINLNYSNTEANAIRDGVL